LPDEHICQWHALVARQTIEEEVYMAKLTEVRWHGRGGQGAKNAGYILAIACAEAGHNIQAFPDYGAERHGPPQRS